MHPIRHLPIELTLSRSSFICGMHSLEGLERPGLHNEKAYYMSDCGPGRSCVAEEVP